MSSQHNAEFKERERNAWASVADGWHRRDALLARGAAPVTERMLDMAGIRAGHRVLDIASGVGEPSLTAAKRVGASGRVVGTDLTDAMLDYARRKAELQGVTNIEYQCVDGETLDFPASTFDAVTCRWGLMFMPEPTACLALVHGVMKDNARLAVACWTAPDQNPFVGLLMQVLANHMELPRPPPGTPGIFALADPQHLQQVIESAGFRNVVLESVEIDVVEVENGQQYWEAMSDLAAPIMMLVNQLDTATRKAYASEVIAAAEQLRQGDTLRMRGTTWVASAEK
ncbi:MAG: class I SAM-dependent methyltransferase [Gammaproteobacteria bacterium]|nr:class I SAM-dependent methyltransferase [Gammaproteobacteria bacterium]